MITQNLKCKIIGGGCSSSQVRIHNPKKIQFSQKIATHDNDFQKEFEKLTNKMSINENIEKENQVSTQVDIIKCLKQHEVLICRNINMYKPKVMELIDIYLIYSLAGSFQQEELKQNEIQELGSLLKGMKESFDMESRENPTCDLIFYFDLLQRFNSTRIFKDQHNKSQLIQVTEFMMSIVKLRSASLETLGENFMKDLDLGLQGVQSLLNSYKYSKTNQIFTYLLDIWVKKKEKFQNRIFTMTLLEELQFYIQLFNELSQKNDYSTDLVILSLLNIDHYLNLALDDQNNLKSLSQELSLNSDLIKVFIPMLIQKSDSQSFIDEMKSFLKFTVENDTYRFLTISILLKYKSIIQDIDESNQYKQQIMEYLCYKYICEKDKSVKLSFETSREFVDYFNSKIEKIQFKDKILQFSNERSKILKNIVLGKYEEKIQNLYDIERMVANRIIEKWELDVKRRQQDNIAQKDDVLLEVQDLYIEQQITYLEGNKIIQPKQLLKQINQKSQSHSTSTALQEILDNFLIEHIQTKVDKNVNISSNKEQNKCKILGILAEGGTGKSMLIKKLETVLISSANDSEIENYIPILIKCNSLHPVKPSIDNYLLEQGVTQQQINSMKKSERSKVILLDGYDEYTGEYFRVYKQLNLSDWKNTKVIVTTRKEKLELSEACVKFSLDGNNGKRDESSFCIVNLEEFTKENIIEYYKMYFKQHRTNEENFDQPQYENDLDAMENCMKSISLEILLQLPINLYLFTRMIVQVKDKSEIQKIKESIYDQIGIQEFFFHEQFRRESQDFAQACKESSKRDQDFNELIVNSFFEYFQLIAMKMFLNKGKPQVTNYLQVRKNDIQFKLSNKIENKLSKNEQTSLLEKIIDYVNLKIITRSKDEYQNNKINKAENKSKIIEFKHKSLFEYFVARLMKQDFDAHGDNIYKLTIEQLKEFNINKKSIMNAGQNQSEQQILIKLYKMISNEIDSSEFYENYHLEQIEKNSRYIQYIKKSTIKKSTEISQIDIGASNLLSILFLSKYTYPKLELSFCSFSKLYVNSQKSDQINFDYCNLQNAYLKNLKINYDSCNIEFALFDSNQKIFDTLNIFSFQQVIWDKSNLFFNITKSGFINAFKLIDQNVVLQKSKQLSQISLNSIFIGNNDTLFVSTQYSLLQINSNSFELLQSYKFKNEISSMIKIKENILVSFKNGTIFHGSFQNGFRKLTMIGNGCTYNESKQVLLVYSKKDFSLYNTQENFELIKTNQGHTGNILSVAFSADGKLLATGSWDKTCKIWDAEKGFELVNTIKGHSDGIMSVAFCEDGKYLVTGSQDKTCKIWNSEKGFELLNTIKGHTHGISSIAFTVDGKYLSTGSYDTCKIWNVEKDFELINTVQGHAQSVKAVAFSANGKYLATGSNECKIWNTEKGFNLVNKIQGPNSNIFSVTFSVNGMYLATGYEDSTCKIWNVEKGFELVNTIKGHTGSVNQVAFSVDGKFLATGSDDNTCKIWNAEKGFELINTIQDHTQAIVSVAFSGDGKYLATGSSDQTCKIWNAEKGFELINSIDDDGINSIAFTSDGKYLAIGSLHKTCKIWNAEKDFELITTIEENIDRIYSVAFSSDGKYLAAGQHDNTCKVWDAEKGFELIYTIQGHTDYVRSVTFSADGKSLATGSDDKTYKIWNVEKGFELINTIQGHTDYVRCAAFSTDRMYLATGSNDNTFKIWNAEKGFQLINTIQGHDEKINSVDFSSNGKYLVTGSYDNTCKIWNVEKGFELINIIQNSSIAAFSSDGKYLATKSDNTCKIWNAEKGFELINKISGHTRQINSVTFSSDGNYLATCSEDNTCKIWNTKKGFKLMNTIQDHTDWILSAAFSSDGKYLATCSLDKTCKIWNLEKDFELINTIQDKTDEIQFVNFSADGKYLITLQMDKICKIWNAEKGFELINTIQGHTDFIISVTFSADGRYIATCSRDNTCKIWNAEKGFELLNKIQDHNSDIVSVAFSADRRYLCVQYNDKSYRLFDTQNQKILSEDEEMNYEKLDEKYQFVQNLNKLNDIRIFENLFIL